MLQDKYFWNRFVDWIIDDNTLHIGKYSYKGEIVNKFPEFYKKARYGFTLEEIYDAFDDINYKSLKLFVNDLIEKGILRNRISRIHELFEKEFEFVNSEYSREFFFNRENAEKFRRSRLNRHMRYYKKYDEVNLFRNINLPEILYRRRSIRHFDEDRIIEFEKFSGVFKAFGQDIEKRKYLYPSAGGLYPINLYVYVKDGRVENMKEGLYLYNPNDNAFKIIDLYCKIDEESQYFTNKDIFKTSGFTVYFTYDGNVNMPKYEGNGYYFGILDCGIMIGFLNFMVEYFGLSSCSIGEMNFDKIEHYFHLNNNEVYLHSVEVGYDLKE